MRKVKILIVGAFMALALSACGDGGLANVGASYDMREVKTPGDTHYVLCAIGDGGKGIDCDWAHFYKVGTNPNYEGEQ